MVIGALGAKGFAVLKKITAADFQEWLQRPLYRRDCCEYLRCCTEALRLLVVCRRLRMILTSHRELEGVFLKFSVKKFL